MVNESATVSEGASVVKAVLTVAVKVVLMGMLLGAIQVVLGSGESCSGAGGGSDGDVAGDGSGGAREWGNFRWW